MKTIRANKVRTKDECFNCFEMVVQWLYHSVLCSGIICREKLSQRFMYREVKGCFNVVMLQMPFLIVYISFSNSHFQQLPELMFLNLLELINKGIHFKINSTPSLKCA